MANKKYYAVVKYETKEEFDKAYNRLFDSGYRRGFEEGREDALSYFMSILDGFKPKERVNAQWIKTERDKMKWQREQELREGYVQLKVKEALEALNES